ncbi:MAG: TIGR01777 family oxidoreductase [Paludibacteraceae bacterium]|nr:TIGR01777 family oxidoreductase [Paludibacteraceae bacterium]MBP6283859.1 TIGR01777 family oxidoreductase [Paludibacteraceae bacterium]
MESTKVVLITGSNGLIAKQLATQLSNTYEVRLLSRNPSAANEFAWEIDSNYIDEKALLCVSHIIHLAGAGIAEKPWTKNRRQEIIASRVNSVALLLEACVRLEIKLDSFISASAIGYYGQTTSQHIYTETNTPGSDFVSKVCTEWEKAADTFLTSGVAERIIKVRTGVVFSKKGGALPKMLLPFTFFVNAIIGNGQQYVPWIHIDDICGIYQFAIENKSVNGAYNAVASEHNTYASCMEKAQKSLNRKSLKIHIPSVFLRAMIGKRSSLLVSGSRIENEKIKEAGFTFQFEKLSACLSDVLEKR